GDERAVGQAVQARRGVDAHDPELPEVALLEPAVLVGELARALLRLERGLEQLAAATEAALRGLEDLLAAGAAGDDGLSAGHLLILLPLAGAGPPRGGASDSGGFFPGSNLRRASAAPHLPHPGLVGGRDHDVMALLALRVAAVGDHAVPQVGRTADRQAGAGELEALPRGPVRLHLGHRGVLFSSARRGRAVGGALVVARL